MTFFFDQGRRGEERRGEGSGAERVKKVFPQCEGERVVGLETMRPK
jgi:hypothetical protein